jgi:hypothetical protein
MLPHYIPHGKIYGVDYGRVIFCWQAFFFSFLIEIGLLCCLCFYFDPFTFNFLFFS